KASNQGVPVILDDQSDAGQAYSDAVDRLLGKEVNHRFLAVKKQGFLQRLFGGREGTFSTSFVSTSRRKRPPTSRRNACRSSLRTSAASVRNRTTCPLYRKSWSR